MSSSESSIEAGGLISSTPHILSGVIRYFAVGLAFLSFATLSLLSLVFNFSTAILGPSNSRDFAAFYWNLWWFPHALFDLRQDPFFTNFIFFPHTINLAYHTFIPFLDLIAIPIYALGGPTVAFNSLILGSLVFSGLAMFALLRQQRIAMGLAFLGGVLFVFTSFTTARLSNNELNMLPMGWLPLAVLTLEWVVRSRTWKSAVALAIVLYLAVATDLQFLMWLTLLLGPYSIWLLVGADAHARRRIVGLLLMALTILVALTLIAPLPQFLAGRSSVFPHTTLGEAQARSLPPSRLISLPPRFYGEGRAGLDVLILAIVLLALVRGKGSKVRYLWLGVGVFCLILALGPTLQPFDIPLPYRLIYELSGGMYRAPDRFILPALFALIVFITLSLQADYMRLTRWRRLLTIVLALLLLGVEQHWYEPFPVFTMPDYRIYHTIGSEPEEYVVLEAPIGAHNTVADVFGSGMELQYYAIVHHKQLINGSVSRAPAGITSSYRQWPLLAALAGEGPIPDRAAAQAEFEQLTSEWDVRYVLIHREMLSSDLANWAVQFFNIQPGWCLVDEEGPLLAYRRMDGGVCPQPDLLRLPADEVIQIGDGSDDRYLGPGWYPAENVGGPQARWTGEIPTTTLQVRLPSQAYRVTLQTTSYLPEQVLNVSANGLRVADLPIGASGWGEYAFDLPATAIPVDGLVTLIFRHNRAASAYDQTGGQVDDRRPLAVAYDSITFSSRP